MIVNVNYYLFFFAKSGIAKSYHHQNILKEKRTQIRRGIWQRPPIKKDKFVAWGAKPISNNVQQIQKTWDRIPNSFLQITVCNFPIYY